MSRTFIRTPLACNTCRRRKTKCDGVRPCCGHCRAKSAQCSWMSTDTAEAETSSPVPDISDPFERLGPSPSLAAEPSLKGLDLCLQFFFQHHFANDFCAFDDQLEFKQKCRQDAILSSTIIALCGRYLEAKHARDLFALPSGRKVSEVYLPKARSLAKDSSDEASVPHIQGNLILAMAELLSNSGSRHWLFAGTAIRMAEIMRLNKEFHQKHSLKDQEIRRRTYWACLLFDRALAYLLAKHRTIKLETVSIAVPGTDVSLAYQEQSLGVTLDQLIDHQRPSDLALSSYLIKTVCLWSDMADFAVYSRRRLEWYPPTDPRSTLFVQHGNLKTWIDSLPPSLCWSAESYHRHHIIGQEKTFVAMQFLLRTASCVAHQCYLPHLTAYTNLVDLVDAAGWSYMHRDESMIQTCVSSALETGDLLSHLMDPSHGNNRRSLQSIWVASSILVAANVFLWVEYSQDETQSSEENREKAKGYFELVRQLISSWTTEWKAAKQWLGSLKAMHDLYKAAYAGDVNETTHGLGDIEPSRSGSDSDSAGDFRPQPGDGYPSLIAMPNLQASVKFATCDTSAKSINIRSIWLQLSSGWLYGFNSHDSIASGVQSTEWFDTGR